MSLLDVHLTTRHYSTHQHWNWVGSTWLRFVWVIRVGPTLKIIWVWPRLDHMKREIKNIQYGSKQQMPLQHLFFVSHIHFSQWHLLAASVWRVAPFISCVHTFAKIPIYNLQRATPINPSLLQDSKNAIYPCRKHCSTKHMQQTYSLLKATSTFTNHVSVLTGSHAHWLLIFYHAYA